MPHIIFYAHIHASFDEKYKT